MSGSGNIVRAIGGAIQGKSHGEVQEENGILYEEVQEFVRLIIQIAAFVFVALCVLAYILQFFGCRNE